MNLAKNMHKKPFVIAGPCSAESEDQLLEIAREIRDNVDVFRGWYMEAQDKSKVIRRSWKKRFEMASKCSGVNGFKNYNGGSYSYTCRALFTIWS